MPRDREFFCQECNKKFSISSNYSRHLKDVHNVEHAVLAPIEYTFDSYIFKCLEGCQTSYATTNRLIDHLVLVHQMDIVFKKGEFKSFGDFSRWKEELEITNGVQYIQHNGKKLQDGFEKMHFKCNRSGRQGRKSANLRKERKNGSTKINCSCTSQIMIKQDVGTLVCYVTYIDFHYGHAIDLKLIKIPKITRVMIAEKLRQGMSVSRVLEDLKENISDDNPRLSLITRKDIHNIKKSFNITVDSIKRHQDDMTSVSLWMEEEGTGVVLCKLPGLEQSFPLDEDPQLRFDFRVADFCIIITSQEQINLLQTLSSGIVCIDSCRGNGMYSYNLTIISVMDEFDEGLPVATMWSNRVDTEMLEIFFLTMRNYAGEILCSQLMVSDLIGCQYDAWDSVMITPTEGYFYAPWSVEKDWQANVNKIKDVDQRKDILKNLKHLIGIVEESEFTECLEDFVEDLEAKGNGFMAFSEYFLSNYYELTYYWALCFLPNKQAFSSFEVLHQLFKYDFSEGKRVRRLDKAIISISKLVNDKLSKRNDRLLGEDIKPLPTLMSAHYVALHSNFRVEYISESKWRTVNESDEMCMMHTVEKNKGVKLRCCDFACLECKICYHAFSCTCKDYRIHRIICKHIHKIIINIKSAQPEVGDDSESENDEVKTTDVDGLLGIKRAFDVKAVVKQEPPSPQMEVVNQVPEVDYKIEEAKTMEMIVDEVSKVTPKPTEEKKKEKVRDSVSLPPKVVKLQEGLLNEAGNLSDYVYKVNNLNILKAAVKTLRSISTLLNLKRATHLDKVKSIAKTSKIEYLHTILLAEICSLSELANQEIGVKSLKMALSTAKSLTALLMVNSKPHLLKRHRMLNRKIN